MSRVPDIRSWWMNQASTSANGALIFLENLGEFSDSDGNCTLTMDPSNWTFTMCPGESGVCGWSPGEISASFSGWAADVCPKCGHTDKPGIVVDGQHRLRGMSSDPAGQELEWSLLRLLLGLMVSTGVWFEDFYGGYFICSQSG